MSAGPPSSPDLARLRNPTGEAGGLPRAAAIDPAFLAAVRERQIAAALTGGEST
jgi:Flp pilus assembly protein protease CpaA